MRNSLFNRRIPTLLAVLMLVGGIGIASYLANATLRITSQASPDEKPQNIRVTNVTDSSFTLTYTTTKSVLGTLSYGATQPLTQTALDDRDTSAQSPKTYTTHSITAKSLNPNITYSFTITSGGSTFLDNGKSFTVTTGQTIPDKPAKKDVTGTILLPDGNPSPNTLVYITAENAQILSTISGGNGTYHVDVSPMRTKDLASYVALTDETKMNLVAATNDLSSQASFILLDATIPPLTLSQNYDFTLGRTILLPQIASDAASVQFPIFNANPVESTPVAISVPQKDEKFTDQKPQFEGTATPDETVEITIQSEEVKATVKAGSNGSWSYRPDAPLTPGEHTVTIKTRDSRGILRTITQSFVVLAEGSQFTEPSVSPQQQSPTPTPSKVPSPTSTISPTTPAVETPTTTLAPTETILVPTFEPSPTITPNPTVQPTGSGTLSTIGIFSFAIMLFGVILLIFTRSISL